MQHFGILLKVMDGLKLRLCEGKSPGFPIFRELEFSEKSFKINLLARRPMSFFNLRVLSLASVFICGLSANAFQERQYICKTDELYRFIRFKISRYESSTHLDARGMLSSNDNTGIELAGTSMSPAALQEDSSSLKMKGNGYSLKLDFKTGAGKLSYGAWDSNCWPGESEWCVIRVPTYNSWSREMHACQKL